MRQDVPSVTAITVALARALATHDPELSRACRDPYAEALLPRVLLPLVRHAQRRGHHRLEHALRALSLGLCDHVALRTALIDRALEHELTRGPTQVVLLGAGLDARAHRFEPLAQSTVYEVDHPATQALKRKKAESLPRAARALHYVPCDFRDTQLEDALTAAGFDPRARSLWLWEGVTMYLFPAAIEHTLAAVARLSASESLLVTTYLTPDVVAAGATLGRMAGQLLGAIAEPLRATFTQPALSATLARAGFRVLSDVAPTDAAAFFGVEVQRPSSLMPSERITVSVRESRES